MRCSDCNKFVSFDTEQEPEIDISVDDDGVVNGTVRIVNTCAECGTELKEGTFDLEVDLSGAIADHREEHRQKSDKDGAVAGHTSLEVEDDGGSRFEDSVTTDRRGKKITNPRYMKHLYGAEVEIKVTCECGEVFTDTWRDSLAGSSMDELT